MRVQISHNSEPRLKIIPLIPHLPVCQLEGRNGIGKSLAVRLLELVSGRQPYLGLTQAWVSLRESLVDAVITIDNVDGATEVVYRLTPAAWPIEPERLRLEDVASVEINGKPSTMVSAVELVQVERLAGDETLAHTLANDIAVQQGELDPLVTAIGETVATWQRRAASLLDSAKQISPPALQAAWALLQESRQRHGEAVAQAESATNAQWNLHRAQLLRARSAEVRAEVPRLEALLATAKTRLESLQQERAALDLELASLLAKRAHNAATRSEAERLARLQRRRQTVLNNRHADVLAAMSWLHLSVEPSEQELGRMATDVRNLLRESIRRSAELDIVGPLLDLGQAVAVPLERAVNQGIGSQPVADLDRPIAAAELLDGVNRRRATLAGQPRPGQLDALKEEISGYRTRQNHITSLQTALQARARAAELVDDVNEQLSDPQFAPSAQAKLAVAAIRDRQHEVHRQLVEAEVEFRRLDETLESLRSDDPDDLDRRAVEAEELASGLVEDPTEVARLVQSSAESVSKAQANLQAASDRVNGLRSTMNALVHELGSDPEFDWVRSGWRSLAKPSVKHSNTERRSDGLSDEELALAGHIERLASVVSTFAERAVAIRNDTAAAFDYLTILQGAAQQRARGGQAVASRFFEPTAVIDRVKSFLNKRYSQQFSQPALLTALFDKANSVQLDLGEYRLHWTGADGIGRHRPLEAFSSGEQAFAYTLARLEIVAARNRTAKNLMVVLDEFGAFVARDRLAELLKAVQTSAERYLEQVVVILPLADSYAWIPSLGQDGDDELSERARQVQEFGYFALTPTTV